MAIDHADDEVTLSRSQLEQLQRGASVGAVASSIAHEFNNVLTTILNSAKLGATAPDAESRQRAFDRILSSARRAAKITSGVLALSRNRPTVRENVAVVALVEDVLAVLEKDLAKHQIRLERAYRAEPRANVVASQIEQVVMNLVINARQAMPKGGTLRVGVAVGAEGMVEIGVKDSGGGMGADTLARIFDPFFTTKAGPDASGQGGSGLGLSICREIVERHHGRIRVESLPGKGSTFTIKLPLAAAASVAQAA